MFIKNVFRKDEFIEKYGFLLCFIYILYILDDFGLMFISEILKRFFIFVLNMMLFIDKLIL